MTTLQWLLLIGAITLVLGFYLYGRRLQDDDPWHGLDHEDDPDSHLDYDEREPAPPPERAPQDFHQLPPDDNYERVSPYTRQSVGDDREVHVPLDPGPLPSADDFSAEGGDKDWHSIPAEPAPGKQVPPPPADLRLRAEARPKRKSRWSFLTRKESEPEQAGNAFDDYDDEPLTAEHLGRRQRIVDPAVQDEYREEPQEELQTSGPQSGTQPPSWLSAPGGQPVTPQQEPSPPPQQPPPSEAPAPDPQLGLNIESQRPAEARERPANVKPGQEKIIVLHVRAREGQRFEGPAIHSALQLCRLKFGMRNIYHRITEVNGYPEVVFSVASMLKPGYLDPVESQDFSTVGLTLFMVLPGPTDGVAAFRDLINTADKLALRLGGEVLDESRTRITHQSAQYMRDEIAELERQWRVPSKSR